MEAIFQVNSCSFQDMDVSASLRAGPGSIMDFTLATQVTGTFFGSGTNLVDISASYIVPNSNTTSSWANTASVAISASWAPDQTVTVNSASWASQSFSSSYLNRGANIYLSQSYISSVTGSTQPSYSAATIWWDDNAKTYAIYSDHEGVALQIGQEDWLRAYAGEYIPNGSPVYVNTAIGGLPSVKLAKADGGGIKFAVVGVATEDIQSGSIGIITSQGQVHDLNLSAYSVGSGIFLSSTQSGSFTSQPPSDPYEKILVGYVLANTSGSSVLQVNVVGLPQNYYPFVGMINVPTMSINNYTASIGTGSVNLCTTSDGSGRVKNYQLNSSSFVVSTAFLDAQYIVATYNNGNPIYSLMTDKSLIDDIQTTIVYTLTPGSGGSISRVGYDTPGLLLANKLLQRIDLTEGIQQSSGLTIGVSGSLYVTITSGDAWNGVQKVTLPSVNSSVDRTILIGHSASLWSSSVITQLDNVRCDNGTNIVPLGGGHYVANWVYRGIGSLNSTIVQLGPDYTQLADCQASQPPEPPPELINIALLVGRVIYKKNGASPENIDSAFTQTFIPSGITDHNNLNNIQGGVVGEYYHLTSASYSTYILNGSSSFASRSISASYAPFTQTEQISASWASASFVATSASFASQSISASFSISASWAPGSVGNSVSSSWSSASFVATSASFASQSISSSYSVSSSWVPNLYPQVEQTSASWASASFAATSASFASKSISSSWVPNLYPQTEQISASWASASFVAISASFASQSISSSYSVTASSAVNAFLATSATTATTATTATSATSASWASASFVATSASFSSTSISSSYSVTASSAVNAFLATTATSATTATTATAATSASWASSSFVSLSSSFASQSISASWAPSVASNFAISASWASASFVATSASFASQSISASWAPPVASNFSVSSSWASASFVATSASFASASTNVIISSSITDNTNYPVVFALNSGSQPLIVDDGHIVYNPNFNRLLTSVFSGSTFSGPVWAGLNVKQFGAVGDGTTDDTVAVQRAISASVTAGVSNRGVELFFPAGVYLTSAPISCSGNNVTLMGAGVGSTALYPQHANGDVLQFGNGGATGTAYVGLMNMSLICPTTRSSGATINVNSANDVLIQNFNITNYFEGIRITGSSIKVRVDNGEINAGRSGSGAAINVINGLAGDTYISNIVTSNTPALAPKAGIQIQQTGHTSINKVNITSADIGLLLNPTSSMNVTYLFCDHSLFDSCRTNAMRVEPAATASAMVRSAVFVNSWFGGSLSGSGVYFTSSGVGPVVDGFKFASCRMLNNYLQGVNIAYSASNNLTFDACTLAGNSTSASNAYYAIESVANVTDLMINGCVIGKTGTATNTQKGAVLIPTGTSSFNILNNNFSDNVTLPYVNIGTITGSYNIRNNIGDTISTPVPTASYALGAGLSGLLFSKGVTFFDPAGISGTSSLSQSVIAWRAPFACTASTIYAWKSGGTTTSTASIQVKRNGTLPILTSSLFVTESRAWVSEGVAALQNQNFSVGDYMEIVLHTASFYVTQVGVQIDMIRQ